MNLKNLMNKRVSDSRKIKDAQETNIIVYGGASAASGLIRTEQENQTAKKFDRFLAQNGSKIMTLSWFMQTMNEFATECNCVVEYSVSSNKNLVDCYLLGAGRISFAIVKAPTKQLIDRLNAGQEI